MQPATGNPMLEAALEYIARGWSIFRLAPGTKVPMRGSHGHLDATTDRATVTRWWTETPDANIGLACGRDGAPIAFDLDGSGGLEEFRRLDGPPTLSQITRRGRHVLYALTARSHDPNPQRPPRQGSGRHRREGSRRLHRAPPRSTAVLATATPGTSHSCRWPSCPLTS
jgi:hypothetical protein